MICGHGHEWQILTLDTECRTLQLSKLRQKNTAIYAYSSEYMYI